MTYQEFKNKYNGRYIDYDGAYGCQCWDLAQYYFVEVLNVPDSVLSGCGWIKNMILWDWKYNELLQYFDEVPITEMNQGDVCIWTSGEGGHIAIEDCWTGYTNLFFSQNPNPCQIMEVNMEDLHAFRRKKETPPPPPEPTPVITPNVEPDENRNQIEVIVPELNVRTSPGGEGIGFANIGYYNYFETKEEVFEDVNYVWYRISDSNWIASKEGEWTIAHPKKEQPSKEQIQKEYIERLLNEIRNKLNDLIEK